MASDEAKVEEFIASQWPLSVVDPRPGGTRTPGENEVPLPGPYVVPTTSNRFSAMFYWDTYYACVGLLLDGRPELAQVAHSCGENFLHLIETLGYVPNDSWVMDLNRSQPPHAAPLLNLLRQHGVEVDLPRWYEGLVLEHAFWSAMRGTPTGLARHWHHGVPGGEHGLMRFAKAITRRVPDLPAEPPAERLEAAAHLMAEAETGWDFNRRFLLPDGRRRCGDFNPADLNALLVLLERTLAELAGELGHEEAAKRYTGLADDRAARMRELMWDDEHGWFVDYDFVRGRRGEVRSSAGLTVLWAGAATEEQAERVAKNLGVLMRDHGLACCEPPASPPKYGHQWDYPNMWPSTVYQTVEGLRQYGHDATMWEVASAYVNNVTASFVDTGELWEKYDAATGGCATEGCYKTPAMLGWTAGVYLHCRRLLKA